MNQSYDLVLFPPAFSFGFTGAPAFDTQITQLDGGGEQRVQWEEDPKWRFNARRQNFKGGFDVEQLVRWFLSRRGAFYGFLFIDPKRFSTAADGVGTPSSVDQVIGVGDGTKTRFKLRVQWLANGDNSGRTHVRFVVPIHQMQEPFFAERIALVAANTTFTASVAVDGVTATATWSLHTGEVILSSAPAAGKQVTWGGYYCIPARFSDNTDKGLEAAMVAFNHDEAAFEIESLPNDEPVPPVPGGTPYGAERWPGCTVDLARSPANGFYQDIQPAVANVRFYLWDPANTPLGGPYHRIHNFQTVGGNVITVTDHLGNAVGSGIGNGECWDLMLAVDGSGNKVWQLLAVA